MIPAYISSTPFSVLADSYSAVREEVGDFHDSLLRAASFNDGKLIVQMGSVYFYSVRQYDCYGTTGAELAISVLETGRNWSCLADIIAHREIYRVVFSRAEQSARLILTDFEVYFKILPKNTMFRWLFGGNQLPLEANS